MSKRNDPGETEYSTGRSSGRRDATQRPGQPNVPTVTPPIADGLAYRGTIATDTMAEAVESQAHLLARPPTAPLPRKPVRRAE